MVLFTIKPPLQPSSIQPSGRERDKEDMQERYLLWRNKQILPGKNAEKFHPKSHIIKHWMTEHREMQQRPPFAFSIVQKYKDCVSRQIGKAIKIYHTGDTILNSTCEYLSNCISRLTVLEDDWEKNQRERNDEEEEYREKALLEEFRMDKRWRMEYWWRRKPSKMEMKKSRQKKNC
jgi:hypothetical protein